MKKDDRTNSFINRFNSVFPALGKGTIQNIISLKMRGHCANSSEYNGFIKRLSMELGLHVSSINGQFQGNAYLITDKDNNALVFVEHETGPEILANILYISGVIGLIQQIMQAWKYANGRFMHRHHYDHDGDIELRKMDKKNHLIEEYMHDHQDFILKLIIEENARLAAKIAVLESKLNKIELQSAPRKKRKEGKRPA
jgi:hypothetical protein